MKIEMFDVIQVDLGRSFGSEQGGIRPAVIVQNNKGNKFSPTVLVIPMTSEIKKVNMPTHNIMQKTKFNGLDDYSGTPAHPGHSSAQPDRTSAHLM